MYSNTLISSQNNLICSGGMIYLMENQRVRLSKELLRRSLTELLFEKNIHKISVREICERAQINRTTFYKYYGSQYDLLTDMENQVLEEIAKVLKPHGVLAFSDEIYQEFSYDRPAASLARYYDNTIVMRGYSKSYGVPGWRLGYVAAPEHLAGVIDQMTTLQQYTFVCAAHPLQRAALSACNCDISARCSKG